MFCRCLFLRYLTRELIWLNISQSSIRPLKIQRWYNCSYVGFVCVGFLLLLFCVVVFWSVFFLGGGGEGGYYFFIIVWFVSCKLLLYSYTENNIENSSIYDKNLCCTLNKKSTQPRIILVCSTKTRMWAVYSLML